MSSSSNGVSRRSLMTATALASLAAMTGCGGGGSSAAAPVPGSPPPPPPPPPAAPVTSKYLYTANSGTPDSIGSFSITASTGLLGNVPGPLGVGANPAWMVAHPTGKFVFVAGDADLRSYVVNQTTGALTLADTKTITTQSGTFATIDVHPDGSVVYVTNTTLGRVDTYSVNATSGVLTQVFSGSGADLPSPVTLYIKVHPNGKFLHASDNSTQISVFPIRAGGELDGTVFPPDYYPASDAQQLVFNTTGTMLYTSNSSVFAAYPCNPTTGVVDTTVVAPGPNYHAQPSGTKPTRLVLHPNNRVIYGIDDFDISMINVDASGTFGTFVGSGFATTSGAAPTALAIDYTGTFLYATLGLSDSIDVFSIAANGALTLLTNVSTGDAPSALAIASFS